MSYAGHNPWDDLRGEVQAGFGASALTVDQFRDTPARLICLAHNAVEGATWRFQMPHGWRPGTSVRPHLHFLALADPAAPQVAVFRLVHTWFQTGPVPAAASWTTVDALVTIAPGGVYKHHVADFGLVAPPAAARESSMFVCSLQRLGTDVRDTYSTNKDHGTTVVANVGVLSIDLHFQMEKDGTNVELFGHA